MGNSRAAAGGDGAGKGKLRRQGSKEAGKQGGKDAGTQGRGGSRGCRGKKKRQSEGQRDLFSARNTANRSRVALEVASADLRRGQPSTGDESTVHSWRGKD